MHAQKARQLTEAAVEVLGLDIDAIYERILKACSEGKGNVILMVKASKKEEIIAQLKANGYSVQLPINIGLTVNIYW